MGSMPLSYAPIYLFLTPCHHAIVQGFRAASGLWMPRYVASILFSQGALGVIKKQEFCSAKSRDPCANGSHPSHLQIEKSDWKWASQETHMMPSDDTLC